MNFRKGWFPFVEVPADNITGTGTDLFLAQFSGAHTLTDSLIKKVRNLFEFQSNSGIRINGRIDLGGAGNSEVVLSIRDNPLAAGGDQKAVDADFQFRSAASTRGAVYRARVNLQDVVFTMPEGIGLHIDDAFKPSNPTLTTLYGIKINDQTKGGTNYAIYTGLGKIYFGDDVTLAAGKDLDLKTNGAYFLPRRISQGTTPTPQTGELLIWHDSANSKVWLVYQDETEGTRKVELGT